MREELGAEPSHRRVVHKHFTSVSPDPSGHFARNVRAPMLGGQPVADMVSSNHAPTRELWIRSAIPDHPHALIVTGETPAEPSRPPIRIPMPSAPHVGERPLPQSTP